MRTETRANPPLRGWTSRPALMRRIQRGAVRFCGAGLVILACVKAEALDPGLTGYWKFEEGTGAVAKDSSGNTNTGALGSAAWTEGRVGSGALDVGPSTGMSVPNPNNQLLPATGRPFSLSMWMKPTDLDFVQTVKTVLIGNPSGVSGRIPTHSVPSAGPNGVVK